MKKNLWVLLALSALIAMFVIAGCAPKPSSPTPTPTPTASPTVPPADTAAPKVVSTDVYKYYGAVSGPCNECWDCDYPFTKDPFTVEEAIYTNCTCAIEEQGEFPIVLVNPLQSPNFKIVITFDENIDTLVSSCIFNPANWTIKVKNAGRVDTELSSKEDAVWVKSVEADGKKIIITAAVIEIGTAKLNPPYPYVPLYNNFAFCGLVCSSDDAAIYSKVVSGPWASQPFAWAAPKVADEICWELSSTCVISDELGNVNCGYSGCDCCLEPTCTTCEEGCPFGDPVCPTCVNPCQ